MARNLKEHTMAITLIARGGSRYRQWLRVAAALGGAIAMGIVGAAIAAVPTPTVIGPIAATAAGDPSRNYPFLSTNLFPPGSGYIEQEFFMEGTATRFSTSCSVVVCPVESSFAPVTVLSTGHPYKIRMVVRRPSESVRFNGYVIVEWMNVSGQYELDVQWYRSADYYVRNGFAYVGVGPQRVGIHAANTGLRAWSPGRYGSLDATAGGTITDDSLKWDIFSQVGKAIASPGGVDPLGGLRQPRTLIATGDSQSSANLATYFNTVHRLEPIYPALVLAGPLGIPIRPDVSAKVFKVPSEWDTISFESAIRQPDTAKLVSWEVAGMSHSPYHTFVANSEVRYRDVGATGLLPGPAQCKDPTRSRVHSNFIFNAAYDWMFRWLRGEQPPSMPSPIAVVPGTTPVTLERDQFGIAVGGIRLPDVSVPVATNTGWNAGGKPPIPDITCQQAGTFIAFDEARLRSLYASHEQYVEKVATAAGVNVQQGFLLPEDANALIEEAQASDVLAAPRSDGAVRVAEFFHPAARMYFWTADAAERAHIDFEGGGGGGWFRTGETFFAWPAASTAPTDTIPVCRFFGKPGVGPSSHFYTANPAECAALKTSAVWNDEGVAFRTRSTCGLRDDGVVRLWSPGATVQGSRHRFAIPFATVLDTIARGYTFEGQVFCVPQ
jgi:hypothetical protein